VTGGSDFLGRWIIETLVSRDYQVRALVRNTASAPWLHSLPVEVCVGHLSETESLVAAALGQDVVVHAAGRTCHWGPRAGFHEDNVVGTLHVMKAAAAGQVQRCIHLSSVAVYGWQSGLVCEASLHKRDADFYSTSKCDAENIALECARRPGIDLTIVRPGVA
jgi:nucleoside-diphosphate-sugar epimerase